MMRMMMLAGLVAMLGWAAVGRGQEYVTPPEGGKVVLQDVVGMVTGGPAANGRVVVVDVQGMTFRKAIRFNVDKAGNPWDVAREIAIPQDIAKGEAYLLGYWARMISTRHESQQGMMTVELAEPRTPYTQVAGGGVTFPGKWYHYWARGASPKDLKAGSVNLKLSAGQAQQVIEIGGIEVLTYGVGHDLKKLPMTAISYAGREPDAPWRKEAQERIAKLRMVPLRVKVIGRDGKPIQDAQVSVEQTRNAFQFGIEFGEGRVMDRTKPENEVYRQKIPELFNAIVFGNALKWEARVGDWGTGFTNEQTIAALQWAKSKGLFVRGHVMVWPGRSDKSWGNLPSFVRAMKDNPDPQAIQQMVLSRIDEVAGSTAGYIDEWDVMNEPRDNHSLIDLCGKPAMAEWFKRAHERLPGVHLAVNEYSILTALSDSDTHTIYEGYIRDLLANGAPVDTIGMQGYFGSLVPTPMRMIKTLDRFGALVPRIRVTEYSIKAEDEDLACDFTRDLLTVLYSHDKVVGFHTWHGVENYINPDGTLTRLGQAYSDLVCKAWKTQAQLKTDGAGQSSVPAHLGRYRVNVKVGERMKEQWLDLRKDGPELIVTVP
jgi:endo-1,4-beta-xylanase